MRLFGWLVAVLMVCAVTPLAVAQSRMGIAENEPYIPRLDDIMSGVQLRHMKMSLAGKAQNWELASYELYRLKAGLMDAAALYSGIPVTNVTTMVKPVQSVLDAIEARDGSRFSKALVELTNGCNACHQSMARGYIVMRVPDASPFSNQVFPLKNKP